MKLVIAEAETDPLRAYLAHHAGVPYAASALVRTELRRTVLKAAEALLPAAEHLLSALALVRLDDALLDTAGRLGPQVVRSLDALHLAAALRVAPLTALITYDPRMRDGARSLGLPVGEIGGGCALTQLRRGHERPAAARRPQSRPEGGVGAPPMVGSWWWCEHGGGRTSPAEAARPTRGGAGRGTR